MRARSERLCLRRKKEKRRKDKGLPSKITNNASEQTLRLRHSNSKANYNLKFWVIGINRDYKIKQAKKIFSIER